MEKRTNIRERIITAIGGVPEGSLTTRIDTAINKAWKKGFNEALEMGGNDEPAHIAPDGATMGHGYRSSKGTVRDLSNWSQVKANNAVYRLWNTHPLAEALIEIIVDYVLGDGFVVKTDNAEISTILEEFLNDPVNRLSGEGAENIVREMTMFGEQLIIAFVRDGTDMAFVGDGRLRLGSIDPNRIAEIVTDEANTNAVIGVRLTTEDGGFEDGPLYKVIQAETAFGELIGNTDYKEYAKYIKDTQADKDSEEYGRFTEAIANKDTKKLLQEAGIQHTRSTAKSFRVREGKTAARGKKIENLKFDGACFFYRARRMSTGLRGRSSLLPMIDWLDRYDQVFFDAAEHVALLNRYVFDLEIKGGRIGHDEPELDIRKQVAIIQRSRENSVYGHNENVKLDTVTPDLKTGELQTLLRSLRVFISGGMRIPEHWIAEGGYTNRATAKEMGQPTYRMLSRNQMMAKQVFTEMCQFQIDVKVGLNQLPESVPVLDNDGNVTGEERLARNAFEIIMPDINIADTASAAQSLKLVSAAIFEMVTMKILPRKPALELLATVAQLLGVELDIATILAQEDNEDLQRAEYAKSVRKLRQTKDQDEIDIDDEKMDQDREK